MEQQSSSRHDVIIGGVGGRGSMIAGQLLIQAAANEFKYVLWCPNMTTARRGAPADCTVVISNDEVGSPLVSRADHLILVDRSRLKPFESRVKSGGWIFIETSGMKESLERTDVKVIEIPGLEIASKLGDIQAGNMVLLGAYVGATKYLAPGLIETELQQKFSGKEKILSVNIAAFREGLKLAPN